jgi:hypothetical protein
MKGMEREKERKGDTNKIKRVIQRDMPLYNETDRERHQRQPGR